MYTEETKIVRWYPKSLPHASEIEKIPAITRDEFIKAIKQGEYCEDANKKVYNPCILNTNDSLFVDIDHIDEYYDIIVSHMNEIMEICPMIIFAKKSFSKSLHFICSCHWDTREEHAVKDMCVLGYIARAILKTTGIDLRNVVGALDKHTKSSEQRLFVYDPKYHDIWFNPYPTEVSFSDAEIDKVFEAYPTLKVKKSEVVYGELSEYKGNFYPTTREDKWTLNKSFNVCGYFGNDARWRVANAILYLCKGDENAAKKVIKDNFKNPGDFSFASAKLGVNQSVLQWVLQNLTDITGGEIEGWLTDKKEEIVQYFKKYHRIELVAPTGTGKTTLVVGNGNIVGLAQELNAVVLCPTNNMMELYSSLKVIHSNPAGGSNIDEYSDDEPCVIIWDQAQKILGRLKNRVIIIDEAHTLYLDRTYRDSAVRMMLALRDFPNIIAITATPTGEEQELKLRRLEYTFKKGLIFTEWITTDDSIDSLMLGDIIYNEKSGYYDRVVVFSDRYVRRIHEKLINRDVRIDHSFIHGMNRSNKDFNDIHKNEMLTKRVTLCTRLAFNGLNFKNKGEHVLVLMDVREKEMLAANIIQCVGRMRNAAWVKLKAYTVPEGEHSTVEQRAKKTQLITDDEAQIDKRLVSYDERLADKNVVDAERRIEDYMNIHGVLSVIKEDLTNTGYFVIKDREENNGITGHLILEEKRRVENEWLDMLLKGKEVDDETEKSPYYRVCENMFHRLTWDYAMRPWYIKEHLEKQREEKHTLPSNTLETLYKKAVISSYSDEEFGKHICRLQRVEEQLEGPIQKGLHTEIARLLKWRNEYKDKQGDGWIPYNMVALQELAMDDLCLHLEEIKERASKAHSVKHKPHKEHKKKLLKVVKDGFVGTKEEIATHIRKNLDTVTRWKKIGKVVEVE